MDIKIVATVLLICRLVSVVFLIMVIHKQLSLFGREASRFIRIQRRVLFTLAIVVCLGNFVPIFIDIATLVADAKRSTPNALGIAYGFSNGFTAMISSATLWVMYKIAEKSVQGGGQ